MRPGDILPMRRITLGWIGLVAIAGCGGAMDAPGEPRAEAGLLQEQAGSERPSVGTLRMRDRDVALTPASLDARGNESLREMTAQPAATPVMADVDAEYQRTSLSEPEPLPR